MGPGRRPFVLATYLFRLLGGASRGATHIHHECDDDLKALDKAYELCADFDVEVWRGQHLVCKVKKFGSTETSESLSIH
jgi:hypothetical protein